MDGMFESNPHTPRRLRSRTVMAAALALALVAAACGGDDPTAAPTTSPVTTSTAPQTPTTTAASKPEPEDAATAESEPVDEQNAGATSAPDASEGTDPSGGSLSGELRWSDVLDDLSASDQACIRESLGEDDLDTVLARPVTSDDFPTDDDLLVLTCIGPERARDVFLSALVWSMQSDSGIVIGDEETACLRESMAGIDVIGMVESPDDSPEAIALMGMLVQCLGDTFLSLMLVDSGVNFEDLNDEEMACLREWQAGIDWDGLTEAAEDSEEAFEEFFAWLFGWLECLPEESGFGFDTGPPELVEAPAGVDDDHANSSAGATAIEVGEAAGGVSGIRRRHRLLRVRCRGRRVL